MACVLDPLKARLISLVAHHGRQPGSFESPQSHHGVVPIEAGAGRHDEDCVVLGCGHCDTIVIRDRYSSVRDHLKPTKLRSKAKGWALRDHGMGEPHRDPVPILVDKPAGLGILQVLPFERSNVFKCERQDSGERSQTL